MKNQASAFRIRRIGFLSKTFTAVAQKGNNLQILHVVLVSTGMSYFLRIVHRIAAAVDTLYVRIALCSRFTTRLPVNAIKDDPPLSLVGRIFILIALSQRLLFIRQRGTACCTGYVGKSSAPDARKA